jgi:FAD/FMN-containing dehydrogenase
MAFLSPLIGPHIGALAKFAGSATGFVKEFTPQSDVETAVREVSNWERGVTYHPAVILQPTTIEDVVRAVTDTVRCPSPLRAVGKLHSPAPCSGSDGGTMLDMTGMTRIIEIGHDFVTAEAGAIYIDVAQELARHGRQFHINTEIGNVTLGAVASAATKDSSLIGTSHWGQVSSFVSALKVVMADGSVRTFTERDNPQEMRLLRSSYGLFGVIVEVTLRTKPITPVFAEHRDYSLAEFRAAVPELVAQNYALMMYYYPFAGRVMVEIRREVGAARPTSSGRWWLRNAFWRKLGPMFATWVKDIAPSRAAEDKLRLVLDHITRRGTCLLIGGKQTDPTAQIIRHQEKPGRYKFVFSMWSFDEAEFFDVLEDYFAFCKEYGERTGFRCDLPAVGYRLTQDSNALLSFTHSANAMSIDPASTGGPGWDDFLRAFNEFASARGGHPLLNQTKHLTPVQVRRAFGRRWEEFAAARRMWDPQDRFLNQYFAELVEPPQMR